MSEPDAAHGGSRAAPGAAPAAEVRGRTEASEVLRLRFELDRLQAENAKLAAAQQELTDAVDLRTRRVNQLLGERDQLERQLVRIERELQRVSRELGAAERQQAPPPRSAWSEISERLRGGLAHILPGAATSAAVDRGPAAGDASSPTAARSGRLIPFAHRGEVRPVVAVVAVGLPVEERERVLDLVIRSSEEQQVVPLVLTDDDDFAPLRARGLAFEYVPPPTVRERFAPALEWQLYLQRRMMVLRRKWQPTRVVAFGKAASELADLWSESAAEDGVLPVRRRPAGGT